MNNYRLEQDFYLNDVLEVAPKLLGCRFVINFNTGIKNYIITEVEAYRGEEDLACHASKGITKRTRIMYESGGHLYVYLIYGMYWMLNVVTGMKGSPQAVLIRGLGNFSGPGKLTKEMRIDNSFYGENLLTSNRIWIEPGLTNYKYITSPRINIDYAGEYWKNKLWNFKLCDGMLLDK